MIVHDQAARRLADASAQVADFCDAMEHVEVAERRDIAAAAAAMLDVAYELWQGSVAELCEAAVGRLRQRILKRSPGAAAAFDAAIEGGTGAKANSLAAVSAAVAEHDRRIEPDFVGRPRMDQLRHLSYTGPKLLAKTFGASTPQAMDKVAVELMLLGVRLLGVVRMPLPTLDQAPEPESVHGGSGPYLARWPALRDLADGSAVYRPRSQDLVGAIFDRELIGAGSLSSRAHLLRLAATSFVVFPAAATASELVPDGSRASALAQLGVQVDAASRSHLSDVCQAAAEPLRLDAVHILDWAGKVTRLFDAGWRCEPGTLDGLYAILAESQRQTLRLLRQSVKHGDPHGASVALRWLGWVPDLDLDGVRR